MTFQGGGDVGEVQVKAGSAGRRALLRRQTDVASDSSRLRRSGSHALRTKEHWWGVVLDAPDGPALAHFYADLLGWTIVDESRAVDDARPLGRRPATTWRS